MKKKYKLLIIDDDENILAVLSKYLRGKKYAVATASNGLEAIKLFESEGKDFDFIITDLVMPYITGVGVISIVKQKRPEIPIIAITGWGEHPEALATESQADLVLKKPFELSELDNLISNLLSKNNNNDT
ncbi:MAG: response regulator [Deltaproteobacteria bacterium]|nr:response regulator [Deltaproteobacteria bacterium]